MGVEAENAGKNIMLKRNWFDSIKMAALGEEIVCALCFFFVSLRDDDVDYDDDDYLRRLQNKLVFVSVFL